MFYLTVNSLSIVNLSPCSTQGAPSHPYDESQKFNISPQTDLTGLFEFGMHFVLFPFLFFIYI